MDVGRGGADRTGCKLGKRDQSQWGQKSKLECATGMCCKICKIRSSIPEVTVDTLSVVPGTMFASCTDHSRLKASVGMHPPTKTARLCHTMKTTVKPPLTLASSNLRAILRGNGLIKQTAAKMINTVSIRQNRKRRRRKLTGVFSLKNCGLDVLLSKPCSSSSLMGFFSSICCSPDVEILLMMRTAYEKGRTKNYVKISLSKAQVIYFLSWEEAWCLAEETNDYTMITVTTSPRQEISVPP